MLNESFQTNDTPPDPDSLIEVPTTAFFSLNIQFYGRKVRGGRNVLPKWKLTATIYGKYY